MKRDGEERAGEGRYFLTGFWKVLFGGGKGFYAWMSFLTVIIAVGGVAYLRQA